MLLRLRSRKPVYMKVSRDENSSTFTLGTAMGAFPKQTPTTSQLINSIILVLPVWLRRAALKKPLWVLSTCLWAENCVNDGPTWRDTSGTPGWLTGALRFRGPCGGNSKGGRFSHGPIDSQARYSEYIARLECEHVGVASYY